MADMFERIENDFTLHPPKDQLTGEKMDAMRQTFKGLANWVVVETPECREQSLAITNLEVALFYAIAAIARNQEGSD